MKQSWIAAALVLVAGCIPSRDNPFDPSVRPDARIDVSVGGDPTATGGRYADWVFDGSGSSDAKHYFWALSTTSANLPAEVAEADWTDLEDANNESSVTVSSSNDLVVALLSISKFEKFDDDAQDQTGFAPRWMRLRVSDGGGHDDTTYARITVVNRAPAVALGPDRRIAPGGRKGLYLPYVVEVHALVNDPDEGDEKILLTGTNPGSWFVEGELATRLDHDALTGLVTDADALAGEPGTLRFEASTNPSRSRLRFEISDKTAFAPGAMGAADVDIGVLSSHWSYGAGDGQFTRLDTSRLVSAAGAPGAARKVLALSEYGSLAFSDEALGRLSFITPGLVMLASTAASSVFSAVQTSPNSSDFFVLNFSGGMRRYSVDFGTLTLTSTALPPAFSSAGFGGFQAKIVSGGPDAVWVRVSDGAQIKRIPLTGVSTVFAPAFAAGAALADGPMVPDGGTGVWISGTAAVGGADLVAHLHADGQRDQETLTDCGLAGGGNIVGMTYDPARDALWISTTPGPAALSALLCVRENGAWAEQSVAFAAALTLNPVDGSVYMPYLPTGQDGAGFSRYAHTTAASIEYVPVEPPYAWWSSSELFATKEGSLVGTLRKTGGVIRYFWNEAGEIPEPQIIIPGIEPYQFELVDYAIDPLTGFLWVWRPDLNSIEAWSPDGQLLRSEYIPLNWVGTEPVRGALAIDPDERRIWFAWAPRYAGALPSPVGRLHYFEIPDVAIGAAEELALGASDETLAPITIATDGNLSFSLLWDLELLPTFGGPRLCIGGSVGAESYLSGFGSMYDTGTGTRVAVATQVSGPDVAVQVAADPYTQDCWFVPGQDETFGGRVGRIDFNGAISILDGHGEDLRRPDGGLGLWSARPQSGNATEFSARLYYDESTSTIVLTKPVATLESSLSTLNPYSVCFDDYYAHLLVGFEEGFVVRLGISPAGGQAEMAVFEPLSQPVLKSP